MAGPPQRHRIRRIGMVELPGAPRSPTFTRHACNEDMRGSQQEKCPRCGFGAGVYVAPREERNTGTPVRCLSCRHEALIEEWRQVAAESEG